MMSSAPAKSAGDARYVSQHPFIQSTLSHTISTPIRIRRAFFLRRIRLALFNFHFPCSVHLLMLVTSFRPGSNKSLRLVNTSFYLINSKTRTFKLRLIYDSTRIRIKSQSKNSISEHNMQQSFVFKSVSAKR